ncbi:MAG: flagellin, partial [Erysipelotrichaceae bacterium]
RIQHNIMALNAHRNSNVNQNNVSKNMEKLSSGFRINRAGDDAAGLSISEKMRSQIRGLDQATNNAQDGISFIQTAEGALTEVNSMLTRMKELVVQSENGTYSKEDKANIDLEIKSLGTEITNITTNTKFNGINVFNPTGEADGFVNIAIGSEGAQSVKIDAATTNLANLTALTSKIPTIDSGAATPIKITSTEVESAISAVNKQRATYGSLQNRLEHTINNQNTTSENLVAAESRIRDVDMAKEMMEMTKNNVLQQAAQAMIAQANQQPQGVLQLLR